MDTPSLKIKFAPLIRDIQKGESRCCLEIVPEVSAIQNLHKIEWKITNDIVEYIIPMTYKIIIKKQKSRDKIYHSCVDLLRSYSIANIDPSYENLARIISDNFFLSKITSNQDRCNIVLTSKASESNAVSLKKKRNTASIRSISDTSTLSPTSDLAIEHYDNIVSSTIKVTGQESSDNCEMDVKVVDYNKEMFNIDEIEEQDANDNTVKAAQAIVYNKANYNPTLSLSPICSVNTYDYPPNTLFYKKSNTAKSMVFRVFNSQVACPATILNKGYICKSYNKHNVQCNDSSDDSFHETRVSPQMRVAHFVQVMEKEISPLKALLNEIRSKCVSLGVLFWNDKCKQNFVMYKTVSSRETQGSKRSRSQKFETHVAEYKRSEKCVSRVVSCEKYTKRSDSYVMSCCRSDKSNRVVYTVVFDD